MLFGRRPSEVACWPAWELDLLEHYMAVEPHPLTRLEVGLAGLRASYAQVHGRKGTPPPSVLDLLPYHEAWETRLRTQGYSETDMEIMRAFGHDARRPSGALKQRRQRSRRRLIFAED